MKINLVLLAAGNSTRFKSNKLLCNFKSKPLGLYIVEEAIKVEFNSIILVTQYDELSKLAQEYSKSIKVVMNKDSEKGISHSIRLGLNECCDCDAVMFSVCDQPYISAKTLNGLIHSYKTSQKGIVVASNDGIMGNPALFDIKYKDKLLKLVGDKGGKSIVEECIEEIYFYNVENKNELVDFDTKEKLEKFIKEFN